MLIKDIVDFENFFHKQFYLSKKNIKQLCKETGMSESKITHWLDKIGPEVKFLDVLKMTKALGFCIAAEKIGNVSIPSVWIGDFDTSNGTTTTNVTDGSVVWMDLNGKVLKKVKKSSKKGR